MKHAPPLGFEQVPPGGMCVCAYLFVTRHGQILLGKYADDPQWEALAGLEPERRRTHGWGWTVPATHLKLGEDPREAAERIRAPGTAVVYGVIVAGSSDPAGDHLRAGP